MPTPLTEDWDFQLHRDTIQMLHRLEESIDAEDETADAETLSGYPYCGCEDCQIREILTLAVPRIVAAYKQGLITDADLEG